jgi:hypothetical protein
LDNDDDDDEVQEVKVESNMADEETDVPKSSAVKKRILQKREREEVEEPSCSTIAPPSKRGKSLLNMKPFKIEKRTSNGGNQHDVICLEDSSSDEEENDDQFTSELLKLEGGLESPSESPMPASETNRFDNNQGLGKGWRCQHCTCLNAPNVLNCTMCNDEDSSAGNDTDELARFLGGGFMDDSTHGVD